VESLALRIEYKGVEPTDEPPPTGLVWIERGPHRAALLTPDEIDPDRRYPLITVLHGGDRQDERLAGAYRNEPERRQALFLVPRSLERTWDVITREDRPDLDFLEFAYDLIYRRYPVDPGRQALTGYSDGASYALSIGLSNPRIFLAVMGWAAGFVMRDDTVSEDDPKPRVLLEYGTHDPMFPFERVALPMRQKLERAGYEVEFRTDEGGRHWPSGEFRPESLNWFFSIP